MTSMSVMVATADERAIAVESPNGEVDRIQPVRQHGRTEEHAIDGALRPGAVSALRPAQPGDAALNGFGARADNVEQGKQRPTRHHRLTLGMLDIAGVETAGIMLAPAAVGLLLVEQPLRRALERGILTLRAGTAQRADCEPGCVGEVDAPKTGPGAVVSLPLPQDGTAGRHRAIDRRAMAVGMLLVETAQRHHRRRRALD